MLDRFEELVDGLNHPEGVAWNPLRRADLRRRGRREIYAISWTAMW